MRDQLPGGYRLSEELGRGGVGTVYAGTGPDGAEVAIKVAEPREGVVRAEWLRREASLAARLRHPHIVQLLHTGTTADGRPFLVYERVHGASVEARADTLTTEEIAALGATLFEALAYAHDAGVLHLDVSPGNLLLRDADHALRLTDFGLATPRDRSRSRQRALVAGTPGYLSPEQALGGGGVSPRSDLFGAGAVLYRLIAGFPPHFGPDSTEIIRHTLYGEPLPLKPRAGLYFGPGLCALVERLIARDPERRPPSADAALALWQEACAERISHAGDPHEPTPAFGLDRGEVAETLEREPAPTRPYAPRGAPTLPHKSAPRPARTDELPTAAERAPTPHVPLTRPSLPLPEGVDEAVLARLPPRHSGGLVRLVGAAGSGRSTAMQQVIAALHRADVPVAWITGRRGEPTPPLEALAGLVLQLAGADGGPPWASAERLSARLERAGAGELRAGREALVAGLLGTARRADLGGARLELFRIVQLLRPPGRPLVFCIDDADTLDAASRSVLEDLAAVDVGVLLVEERDAPAAEAAEPRDPNVVTVPSLDPPLADRLLTGGAPPDEVGARLDALLARRTPAERRVLAAAALFRGDAPRRALAALAAEEGGAAEVVTQLEVRGLLRSVVAPASPIEPRVRLACPGLVRRALPTGEEARALARRAARWLSRESLDPGHAVLLRIADFATASDDLLLAAFAAAEAGRRAAVADDPSAATSLARALELAERAPGAIDEAGVWVELADEHLRRGDHEAAEEAALRALETSSARREVLRARALRLAARAASDRGASALALTRLEEAIALLEPDGDPMELALAHSSLGWQLGYVLDRNAEGIAHGRRALEVAARIDAPAFQAQLCGRLGANQLRAGDWDGQLGTNLRDLGLSLLAGDVQGVMRAHINVGVCHTNRGLLALARAHTEEGARLAAAHGARIAEMIAENNLAMLAADEGRLADARAHVARSLDRARERGLPGLAETWAVLVRVALEEGQADEAREAARKVREVARASERTLAARVEARLDAGGARDALRATLAEVVDDPYERATTRCDCESSPS